MAGKGLDPAVDGIENLPGAGRIENELPERADDLDPLKHLLTGLIVSFLLLDGPHMGLSGFPVGCFAQVHPRLSAVQFRGMDNGNRRPGFQLFRGVTFEVARR